MPRKAAIHDTEPPVAVSADNSPSQEIEKFSGDPDFMTSLARGLSVIRAFDQNSLRLSVAQVSERTGFPRSAARRCLYTLQCLGYVGVDGSNFFLKPRVVALGHVYLTATPLSITAQPVLDAVARDVGETCTLAVLDHDEILFVAHSSKAPLVSVNIAVGSRLPAYCTANGLILLGALAPHELEDYLSRVKFVRLTGTTISSKKKLVERIAAVKAQGYAVVDQEFNEKIRSVAIGVRSAGRVAASMSIAVPVERVSVQQLTSRLLPFLRSAASEFA